METLRKNILNALTNAPELIEGEGSFEQYCNVFFNRRSKENTCIMFGIKKQELMSELFGFRYPTLINDAVHYLVRIQSSQQAAVQITFKGAEKGYTTEQQEWFRALYSHYNADKNVKLSLFFSQKLRVPPLTFKDDWATEFMSNPNENFRYLDGEKLIEKVEIKHPKVIDVELYKSLDDVFLIPEKYSMFAEYKKSIQQDVESQKKVSNDFASLIGNIMNFGSADEKDRRKSAFWNNFSERVCDIDRINFTILNHNDDFMVLSFCNLIDLFRKKYANINLLKRIFFVYDETSKETKVSNIKELPDATKKLFKELNKSLCTIETVVNDSALYVCALEFLESIDSKTKQKNEKTLSEIKKMLINALKNNLLK